MFFLAAARDGGRVFDIFGQFVTGFNAVQTRIVVFQAFQAIVRCFQGFVGHQQHVDALFHLDFADFRTFLIQQERRHINRHLAQHGGRAVFQRFFLDDAQNLQRRAFGVANVAGTTAAWARNRCAFGQCRAQALAAHLHEAELADGAKLHAGAVLAQCVTQTVLHIATVAGLFHVDEVDNDQATQVTQTHLARHFVGGFQVGPGRCFLNVAAFDGTGGVNVHRHQCFSVVDNNRAAAGQLHGACVSRLNLVLNLEAAEQGGVVTVAFDAVLMLRHHVCHELASLFVHVVGVEQDVAYVAVEVIADGPDHEAGFLVNQESTLAALARALDGGPELDQVVQVPLQFRGAAADARCARNDAGAGWVFQLVHVFFQLGPIFTFDTTAHTTASRIVRHQHHIATSQ